MGVFSGTTTVTKIHTNFQTYEVFTFDVINAAGAMTKGKKSVLGFSLNEIVAI